MADSELHLGSTYGFIPAACAGEIAGIEMLEDGDIMANVRQLEEVFLAEMRPLVGPVEQVGDARAVGALAALEFVQDKATIRPAPNFRVAVHQAALRRGVLGITQRGKWHLRLQPALTMPPEVFGDSCLRIKDAVLEVDANPPAESERVLDSVAGSSR